MATPLAGQIGITAAAQALTTLIVDVAAFTIKAASANSGTVYLGPAGVSTSSGFMLEPGDRLDYQRVLLNGVPSFLLKPCDFYVVGTLGDKVSWFASP